MKAFQITHDTVNIDVSSSSQSVDLGLFPEYGQQVVVMNDGSATVRIKFAESGGSVTTTAGKPVAAGAEVCFTLPPFASKPYAYARAAGSTGKVYFTPGRGI